MIPRPQQLPWNDGEPEPMENDRLKDEKPSEATDDKATKPITEDRARRFTWEPGDLVLVKKGEETKAKPKPTAK